jgi:DNA mismatch repair protein MutS
MVEMLELANILNTATNRSLILLDEVGRGTSTFDGLSIAWSVCEFINDKAHIGAKTLFATHYHHLNELEEVLAGVKNYNIAVKEDKDKIIFLYKVSPGGTNRSYGIQVARLAGVPHDVIERAKTILARIEAENLVGLNGIPQQKLKKDPDQKSAVQLTPLSEIPPKPVTELPELPEVPQVPEGRTESPDESIHPSDYSRASRPSSTTPNDYTTQKQLRLFAPPIDSDPILDELRKIDIKNMTPIQALNKLYEVQKKINGKSLEK